MEILNVRVTKGQLKFLRKLVRIGMFDTVSSALRFCISRTMLEDFDFDMKIEEDCDNVAKIYLGKTCNSNL